jgi:two-component system NtrC family sensor kinase
MESHYPQLARRMVALSLLVSLVPLYIVGAAIYIYFTAVQEQSHSSELRTLAVNRANAINMFLAERTAMVEALTQAAPLWRLTEQSELRSVLRLLNRRRASFVDLGVVDGTGRHLAYAGPYALKDRWYGDAPWFEETMVRGVYVSDVFLGFRNVPHFVVAVRSSQEEDEPWILRATIDSDVFTTLVRGAQLGSTGDAFVVNREGRLQTPLRFDTSLAGEESFDVSWVPPGVSVQPRTLADGRRVLTACVWLDDKDWLLVVQRDPNEALATFRFARKLELLMLAVASVLITGAIMFLVRLLVRRLQEQDRQRASMVAQLAHSGRLASMGRMAAGVAHEINNPLATIGELSGLMEDLIDERFMASHEHGTLFRDSLRKIQDQVERARTVTHRMLGFARRMEPRQDAVNPNDVVAETMAFVEREASFRNLQLVFEPAAEMPVIRTDRAQLQQVVLNLLNNALDAVIDGGHVTLRSRVDDEAIVIEVEDDGCGIPRDVQDRIFDPFFTTKEPGRGNGLGLSISHTIMQQLGGSLSFKSRQGAGTTFFMRLPRTEG